MNHKKIFALSPIMLAFGLYAQTPEVEVEQTEETVEAEEIEQIRIIGSRMQRTSAGATGLSLDSFDTPQSLTVIDSETIDNFSLVDIKDLFRLTTGINVDQTETDRSYFNARGFEVTSMHVDGSGIPFGTIFIGDLDTAIYEKVDFIRGSNGLITGIGNPSGTINYSRKRPTNDFQATAGLTLGRWNNKRVVADVSTPLTESGSWAARAVVAYQDKESWLNLNENSRTVLHTIVDGQLTDDVTVTFGYTYQDNNSDGVTWGGVPMIYSNGTQVDFDVSTTTSMDWTYWDVLSETFFAEVSWFISDELNFTSKVNKIDGEQDEELFYIFGGLDEDTGLGLYSYPGKYSGSEDTLIWDNVLNGTFSAWGKEHKFNLGVSLAKSDTDDYAYYAASGYYEAMPAFPGWTGTEFARPTWGSGVNIAYNDLTLNRYYGSVQLAITDNFDLVTGLSIVDYESEGDSYGVSADSTEDGSSPYIGFTWEVAENLNLYGSYSDIYQPQYYLNENLEQLGSAQGRSYEFGAKKRFSNNLLVSLALFRTEQENLYEFVGYTDGDGIDDDDYSDDFTYAVYKGVTVESQGFEIEISGEVYEGVTVQAGLTSLTMDDENGDEGRTFVPRNTLKLLADWQPAWQEKLNLGVSLRWQSEIYSDTDYGRITQDSYAVVGAYAQYDFNNHISLALNLDNITDEKYLSSVRYEQAFYAAPANYRLTLNYKF